MDNMRKQAREMILKNMKKKVRDEGKMPMSGMLKPKMKVTVASDSPEGLEEGLSKAEMILKKRKEMMSEEPEMEESEDESEDESPEDEMMEDLSEEMMASLAEEELKKRKSLK